MQLKLQRKQQTLLRRGPQLDAEVEGLAADAGADAEADAEAEGAVVELADPAVAAFLSASLLSVVDKVSITKRSLV